MKPPLDRWEDNEELQKGDKRRNSGLQRNYLKKLVQRKKLKGTGRMASREGITNKK